MKVTTVKGLALKAVLGVTALGTLFATATPKADAQVFVGFGFGRPAPVIVPAYPRRDFYFDRRAEIIRHDEWIRAHRFDRRFGFYR